MKELWTLFITFMRIGGFTFGGGYAMLPMIQKEVVERHGWATDDEILNYYAVGQCTPGVIAVNTATFIGYKQKGAIGGVVATLGVIAPSLVIITIIAACLQNFAHYQIVQYAFSGIRVAVSVLIVSTVVKLWKNAIKDWKGIILCVIAFTISAFTPISPVYVVIGAIIAGIVIGSMKGGKMK